MFNVRYAITIKIHLTNTYEKTLTGLQYFSVEGSISHNKTKIQLEMTPSVFLVLRTILQIKHNSVELTGKVACR